MEVDWQDYRLKILPDVKKALKQLAKKLGRPMYNQVRTAILDLKHNPIGKTQPLGGKLSGLRSLHCARCRVVVHINEQVVVVTVVGVGWHTSGDRTDIYKQVQQAIDEGTIDLDDLNSPDD